MKRYIKAILLTFVPIFLCAFCSCSLLSFDKTEIRGGTPLSDELLAAIKGEIFSEGSDEGGTKVESEYSDKSDMETESSREESLSMSDDSHTNELVDNSSESSNENIGNICYWTESGSVWHTYKDCYHIKKSTNILSGTVEEAKEEGKSHICTACAKREE